MRAENLAELEWLDFRNLETQLQSSLDALYPSLNESGQGVASEANGDRPSSETLSAFFDRIEEAASRSRSEAAGRILRHRVANTINLLLASITAEGLEGETKERSLETARDVVKILEDAGSSCADRASLRLEHAEKKLLLHKYETDAVNILVNMFKHNAVHSKLVDINDAEEVETYLFWLMRLNIPLGLEVGAEGMLYSHMATVQYTTEEAIRKVCETFNEQDLVGYIAGTKEFQALYSGTAIAGIQATYQEKIGELDIDAGYEKKVHEINAQKEKDERLYFEGKAREELLSKGFLRK